MVFWTTIVICTYLLFLICLQYIPIQYDIAFLATKQSVIGDTSYKIAFFTHVFTAIFTIILGAFQFWKSLRIRFATIHKTIGKLYIITILLFSAPSGLIMSIHANGGPVAQISFFISSILWFSFTMLAFNYARKKQFLIHQKFAIRSYALTLTAISLRLLKLLIANTICLAPMDSYRVVSWSSWLVNLCIAEIIIYFIIKKKKIS